MKSTRRVLLPTDFSPGALLALERAVELSARTGAELHLLHVVTPEITPDALGFPELKAFRDRMHSDVSPFLSGNPEGDRPVVRYAVRRHSKPAWSIVTYASDVKIDLLVMARSGRNVGEPLSLGSTAEKVMRLAPCDVLTSGMVGLWRPDLVKRILVPVDFSQQSGMALERARRFAARVRAHLTVLHVVETTLYPGVIPRTAVLETESFNKARISLERFYRNTRGPDVPHAFSVIRGRPADGINDFAKYNHMHLIVQGSRGRSGIEHTLLGSVAEQVVRRVTCPVLTVKSPNASLVRTARKRTGQTTARRGSDSVAINQ